MIVNYSPDNVNGIKGRFALPAFTFSCFSDLFLVHRPFSLLSQQSCLPRQQSLSISRECSSRDRNKSCVVASRRIDLRSIAIYGRNCTYFLFGKYFTRSPVQRKTCACQVRICPRRHLLSDAVSIHQSVASFSYSIAVYTYLFESCAII